MRTFQNHLRSWLSGRPAMMSMTELEVPGKRVSMVDGPWAAAWDRNDTVSGGNRSTLALSPEQFLDTLVHEQMHELDHQNTAVDLASAAHNNGDRSDGVY